jgi:hypothetical protein
MLSSRKRKKVKLDGSHYMTRSQPHSEIDELLPLSAAESAMLKCAASGKPWNPINWDCQRPQQPTEENAIRGELIRFLLKGGDSQNSVFEGGIRIIGAWITGTLNLQNLIIEFPLTLKYCHMAGNSIFSSARIPSIDLSHSFISGLKATSISISETLNLISICSIGCIDISRATIGDLYLSKAHISNENGLPLDPFWRCALNASGARVAGNVRLDAGLKSDGEINLCNSIIDGDLALSDSSFRGCGGEAINAERMRLKGSLFFRNSNTQGLLSFASASASTLIDDLASWGPNYCIIDGFSYQRIIGPTDTEARIKWLNRQVPDHLGPDFKPQPWEHLIKTLRSMGHTDEACEIAIAKQQQLMRAGRIKGAFAQSLHFLSGHLIGFGYRPLKLLSYVGWFWFLAAFLFSVGGTYGYMGPTDPDLYEQNPASQINAACGDRREVEKQRWATCTAMPPEYTRFQPWIYSLDLTLPLVDLRQERDWAPIVADQRGHVLGFGVLLRWIMWLEILVGWLASLIFVAVFGRLVEKD